MKWIAFASFGGPLLLTPAGHAQQAKLPLTPPLELRVRTNHTRYQPDEKIEVTVMVTNRSTKPLVIARAIMDTAPAAYSATELFWKGKKVWFVGDPGTPTGIMRQHQVATNRFVRLAPGKSLIVSRTEISKCYVLTKEHPKTKQDFAEAATVPLKPSAYDIMACYEFRRDTKEAGENEKALVWEPGAKPLYRRAWTGQLTTQCHFVVVER